MMNAKERSVLRNVVAVARHELADREADEIPPRLRRVAKNSSRALPPPFADSVLREVRENASFREAVRERWEDEKIVDSLGLAFLEDPDSVGSDVVESVKDIELLRLEGELADARSTIASLEEMLGEAKRRLAGVRSEHDTALSRRRHVEEASKAGLMRTIRDLEAEVRAAASETGRLTDLVGELEADLAMASERFARSSERESKRRTAIRIPRSSSTAQPPKDPVVLAAWLDTVERTQRPYREPDLIAATGEVPGPVAIPSGIQPDSREAVAAVVEQKPDLVVVDGYNVAGSLDQQDFSSHAARASVIAKAERLRASCGSSVIVVFDAADTEGRPSFRSTGGVDVVFSRNRTADDEIVEIVRGRGERSVVVTTDRELRERCAEFGAVTVWSGGFVDWSNC